MWGSDWPARIVMVAFAVALVVLGSVTSELVSYSVMVLPMFLAGFWLGPRPQPWYVVFCLLGLCVMLAFQPRIDTRTVLQLVVTFLIGLLLIFAALRRSRLGVSGPRSESMFVDLRDRISKQGVLPDLPSDWYVESATRSSGGTAFGGDFVVAGRSTGPAVEMVLVDVSGKGVDAGTRSLLLSGAFGGLLSALPPEEFLPRASAFLLAQDWEEGFATAIHLHLDTDTGDFQIRKAGHPPAIWLKAGSGGWQVLDSDGPVLGIIEEPDFEVITGRLSRGDGLLLYTDGLVETTRRDIASGIDKLAGLGQRLFQLGFDGGAAQVLHGIGRVNDDLALLLVHRR